MVYHCAMPDTAAFSCALVTGASSGLGEEFALQIAPRVGKLVLVARREPLLLQLADRIRARFPHVAVAVFAVDLQRSSERDQLVAALATKGFLPDLLVNNAGLGDYGEFVSAEEALQYGLVNRVVPAEELEAEARALADKISEASPLVVGVGKQAFYRQLEMPTDQAYAYTKEVMSFNATFQDAQEGMCAFLEKRKPEWKGR